MLLVLIFLIASQSKKLKGLFTYQAAVKDAWFDKGDYNGDIPTNAKAGLFKDRGGFSKLVHKFLKPLKDKVACNITGSKITYLFQM